MIKLKHLPLICLCMAAVVGLLILLLMLVNGLLASETKYQLVNSNEIVLDQPNVIVDNLYFKLGAHQPPGQVITVRADNITLQNCIIEANYPNQDVSWSENEGILVYRCSGTKIINCQIYNTGFDAIHFRECSDVFVSNCVIKNCGEGILFEISDNCIAEGNTLESIGTDYHTTQDGIEWSECNGGAGINNNMRFIDGSGYDVFNSSHINLKDGLISDYDKCGGSLGGVYLQGTDGYSNFNLVDNLTIQKSIGAGVAIFRANYNTIKNVSFKDIIISPEIVVVDNSVGNLFQGNVYDVKYLFYHDMQPEINNVRLLPFVAFGMFFIGLCLIMWGMVKWIRNKKKVKYEYSGKDEYQHFHH
jgi:parallel beta-helix repeat protein